MASKRQHPDQVTSETVPAKSSAPLDVTSLVESMAGFTRDFYDKISKTKPDGNLLFSPFSLTVALGMTYVGARNKTAEQMAEALKLQSDVSSVSKAFEKLLSSLNRNDAQYILSTANSLFVDKKFSILDDYLATIKSAYQSDVTKVNFEEDSEGSRSTVNQWVEKETNSKIKDLIPAGMLTPLTKLILVNAIYFKGNWKRKFNPDKTHPRPFHLAAGRSVTVDMMYKKAKFPVGRLDELDCQILELPYIQNDLSMFILLPQQKDGLTRLEGSLTPAILQSVCKFVSLREVEIYLPKFKLEEGTELKKILSALGIKDLYLEGVADLSGIDGTKCLYVADVLHKAFIEVNEEGTEAAAATGMHVQFVCCVIPIVFNADHPFLFFILDNRTGTILFIGRLTQPESSKSHREEL